MSERVSTAADLPEIIQGGMGVAVSNWELAGEVAKAGMAGVVSGTAIGHVLARRLQDGDEKSSEALQFFPDQEIAKEIIAKYFQPSGRNGEPYRVVPMFGARPTPIAEKLAIAGAFVEVHLAKQLAEGNGTVGINLLTKIETPTISTLYGAMLAGVDFVVMGAGYPGHVPEILKALAAQSEASMQLTVSGETRKHHMVFDPKQKYPRLAEQALTRPLFLGIIASHILAKRLIGADGFVVERPIAGGHNAPPRRRAVNLVTGEPLYDDKDEVNLTELAAIGKPFWLAGGFASPDKLLEAEQNGARGVQLGSVFALSKESGFPAELKRHIIAQILAGEAVQVFTDPLASPTGFPFKVAQLAGTLSDARMYQDRARICDLGYLRELYELANGSIGYRCASEPEDAYIKKGGSAEGALGRKCLCNALLGAIGMGQVRDNGTEQPIVTLG